MRFLNLMFLSIAIFSFGLKAQTNTTHSLTHNGLNREYKLYVPQNYSESTSVPLLLNLHGYTSDMTEQEVYGDFRAIADTANFIIVHPNGTIDNSGNRFWNAFQFPGVDDVSFLTALIDKISEDYNIDANRVYSTGMSNGGFMSYELACMLSDKITAVASVTGAMTNTRINTCSPSRKVPALQVHGTNDLLVPIDGNIQYASIVDVITFWVNQHEISSNPITTDLPDINQNDNSTVTWSRYLDGSGRSAVEYFKIHNGGHTWPGSTVSLPNEVTNQDINASVEIWRFFSQHQIGDETLETEEIKIPSNHISLFPNPSGGIIQIKSSDNITHIKVFDVLGKKVLDETPNSKDFIFEKKEKGVYIAHIISSGNQISKKFIIH